MIMSIEHAIIADTPALPGDPPPPGSPADDAWMPRLHVGGHSWPLTSRTYASSPRGREIRATIHVVAGSRAEMVERLAITGAMLGGRRTSASVTLPNPASPAGGLRLVERQISAPPGSDDGLEIDWELLAESNTGTSATLTVTVRAPADDDEDDDDAPRRSTDTGPDGLLTVEDSGRFEGDDAMARYETRRADFEAAHPTIDWIYSHRVTRTDDGRDIRWTLSAERLRSPLPQAGGAATVVDGEVTTSLEIEPAATGAERLTISVDLLLTEGDPDPLYEQLRAAAEAQGLIVRETRETPAHRASRLRATFEVRRSASGLLDWEQGFALDAAGPTYEPIQYSSRAVLVRRPTPVRRLVQSGRATGHAAHPAPPPPASETLLEVPSPRYDVVGAGERRTSWQYVMAVGEDFDPSVLLGVMGVPAEPAFEAGEVTLG